MKVPIPLLALVLATFSPLARPQSPSPEFTLKEDKPATGTSLKRDILRGSQVPLDREWNELSVSQQNTIRREYESLPDDHEPPFPKGGLQTIYRPIADAYQRASGSVGAGELLMVATVDKEGVPTKLDVYKTVGDSKFTAFAAGAVLKAQYKPARCGTAACPMQFVVAIKLLRE